MTAGRSAGLVRRWVALYTLGLPHDIRDARREEIEDDLWCQAHEVDPEVASGDVLGRLVFGLLGRHHLAARAAASRSGPPSPEERNDGHAHALRHSRSSAARRSCYALFMWVERPLEPG